MYQRFVIEPDYPSLERPHPAAPIYFVLTAQFEQYADDKAQDLIDRQKKERGEKNHDEHHDRRHHGLAASGPSDLGDFGTHLLEKGERIGFRRHDPVSSQLFFSAALAAWTVGTMRRSAGFTRNPASTSRRAQQRVASDQNNAFTEFALFPSS